MKQDFILQNWSVWPPLDKEVDEQLIQQQRLSVLPKMLKRRLSPLARIVFTAAIPCLQENQQLPTVFSSTHGELAKSLKMMEMIEAGDEISPTAFSLSVHNAIAGLFSIAFNNQAESTVVAAGEEGIAAAFIEAAGVLQEGAEQVLIVFYDEPLPKFYPAAPFKLTTEKTSAVALLLAKKGSGTPIQLSQQQSDINDGEQALQMPLLIQFLASQQNKLQLHTHRHCWCWEKG